MPRELEPRDLTPQEAEKAIADHCAWLETRPLTDLDWSECPLANWVKAKGWKNPESKPRKVPERKPVESETPDEAPRVDMRARLRGL